MRFVSTYFCAYICARAYAQRGVHHFLFVFQTPTTDAGLVGRSLKDLRVVEWVALIRFLFSMCHY